MSNLILTEKAQRVLELVNKGKSANFIVDHDIEALGDFVSSVVTSSDEFWYSLTNGYINFNSVMADKEQIKEVEHAIRVLCRLEDLINKIGC